MYGLRSIAVVVVHEVATTYNCFTARYLKLVVVLEKFHLWI